MRAGKESVAEMLVIASGVLLPAAWSLPNWASEEPAATQPARRTGLRCAVCPSGLHQFTDLGQVLPSHETKAGLCYSSDGNTVQKAGARELGCCTNTPMVKPVFSGAPREGHTTSLNSVFH